MGHISVTTGFAVLLLITGTRAMNATESNACYGNPGIQDTSNYIFCPSELEICIEEARFYEHIPTPNCPSSEITAPSPDCCKIQDQQCYWKGNVSVVQALHDDCNSTRSMFGQCLLPAGSSISPPTTSLCSNDSSIRVLFYTCRNGTCPDIVPETTTTTTTEPTTTGVTVDNTTTTAPTTSSTTESQTPQPQGGDNNDTAAIVGGCVGGGLALICIIAIAVVTCRKNRSKKYIGKGTPQIPHYVGDNGETYAGTYNVSVSTADEKTHM